MGASRIVKAAALVACAGSPLALADYVVPLGQEWVITNPTAVSGNAIIHGILQVGNPLRGSGLPQFLVGNALFDVRSTGQLHLNAGSLTTAGSSFKNFSGGRVYLNGGMLAGRVQDGAAVNGVIKNEGQILELNNGTLVTSHAFENRATGSMNFSRANFETTTYFKNAGTINMFGGSIRAADLQLDGGVFNLHGGSIIVDRISSDGGTMSYQGGWIEAQTASSNGFGLRQAVLDSVDDQISVGSQVTIGAGVGTFQSAITGGGRLFGQRVILGNADNSGTQWHTINIHSGGQVHAWGEDDDTSNPLFNDLFIGAGTGQNTGLVTLNIGPGGRVSSSSDIFIGGLSEAAHSMAGQFSFHGRADVFVDGPGAQLQADERLGVGSFGGRGYLEVRNGGEVFAGEQGAFIIGKDLNTAALRVTGAGSRFIADYLLDGPDGGQNYANDVIFGGRTEILDGGYARAGLGATVRFSDHGIGQTFGQVHINGAGSQLEVYGDLRIESNANFSRPGAEVLLDRFGNPIYASDPMISVRDGGLLSIRAGNLVLSDETQTTDQFVAVDVHNSGLLHLEDGLFSQGSSKPKFRMRNGAAIQVGGITGGGNFSNNLYFDGAWTIEITNPNLRTNYSVLSGVEPTRAGVLRVNGGHLYVDTATDLNPDGTIPTHRDIELIKGRLSLRSQDGFAGSAVSSADGSDGAVHTLRTTVQVGTDPQGRPIYEPYEFNWQDLFSLNPITVDKVTQLANQVADAVTDLFNNGIPSGGYDFNSSIKGDNAITVHGRNGTNGSDNANQFADLAGRTFVLNHADDHLLFFGGNGGHASDGADGGDGGDGGNLFLWPDTGSGGHGANGGNGGHGGNGGDGGHLRMREVIVNAGSFDVSGGNGGRGGHGGDGGDGGDGGEAYWGIGIPTNLGPLAAIGVVVSGLQGASIPFTIGNGGDGGDSGSGGNAGAGGSGGRVEIDRLEMHDADAVIDLSGGDAGQRGIRSNSFGQGGLPAAVDVDGTLLFGVISIQGMANAIAGWLPNGIPLPTRDIEGEWGSSGTSVFAVDGQHATAGHGGSIDLYEHALITAGLIDMSGGDNPSALAAGNGGRIIIHDDATMRIKSATVDLRGGVSANPANSGVDGFFDVRGSLEITPDTSILTRNGGGIVLNGGSLATGSGMTLHAAILGSGAIGSPGELVRIAGELSPGHVSSPAPRGGGVGEITFAGDLALDPSAIVRIDLYPAGLSDTIVVAGRADIDGTLVVTRSQSYVPTLGDSFTFLQAGSGVFGEFDVESLPALSGGLSFWVANTGDSLQVRVIPAPGAAVLLLSGLIAAHRRARRETASH